MNFFCFYVSLPALLVRHHVEDAVRGTNNPPFLIATTLAPPARSFLAMIVGGARAASRSVKRRWRSCRRIRQYRLHGPGPGAAVLGAKAAAPTALIFCCDAIFLFSIVRC